MILQLQTLLKILLYKKTPGAESAVAVLVVVCGYVWSDTKTNRTFVWFDKGGFVDERGKVPKTANIQHKVIIKEVTENGMINEILMVKIQ